MRSGNTSAHGKLLLYLSFKAIFLLDACCCLRFTRITMNHEYLNTANVQPAKEKHHFSFFLSFFLFNNKACR